MSALSRVFGAIARALGIHPSRRREPLRRALTLPETPIRVYILEWDRHINLTPDGASGYIATCPEVPEFASVGRTVKGALRNSRDGMATAARLYEAEGREMPRADGVVHHRAAVLTLGGDTP